MSSSAFSFHYSPTLTSIHDYWKSIALTRWTFVGKVMSLPFNMLLRLVIAFLPRSKHLLNSWLQSPSAVILEPQKIEKSSTILSWLLLLCAIVWSQGGWFIFAEHWAPWLFQWLCSLLWNKEKKKERNYTTEYTLFFFLIESMNIWIIEFFKIYLKCLFINMYYMLE